MAFLSLDTSYRSMKFPEMAKVTSNDFLTLKTALTELPKTEQHTLFVSLNSLLSSNESEKTILTTSMLHIVCDFSYNTIHLITNQIPISHGPCDLPHNKWWLLFQNMMLVSEQTHVLTVVPVLILTTDTNVNASETSLERTAIWTEMVSAKTITWLIIT